MEDYIRGLMGAQVREVVTSAKDDGTIFIKLHLFKEGKLTVLTVEEINEDRTCRWIDGRLLVLGHFGSLMTDVVKTEMVKLELITIDAMHGKFQASGSERKWVAFTHIVLKWKNYKVFLGDTESDDVLTSGSWPSHIPFEEGAYPLAMDPDE